MCEDTNIAGRYFEACRQSILHWHGYASEWVIVNADASGFELCRWSFRFLELGNLTPLQQSSFRPSFVTLHILKGHNACAACSHPLRTPFTSPMASQTQLCIAGC